MNLTPQEALQAIADGKKLECKWFDESKWITFNPLQITTSIRSIFKRHCVFRLAQEMITIGDASFPKPETIKPELNTRYWVADPISENFTRAYRMEWVDDSYDNRVLSRGLLHLSEENAIAHAKALIKLSGGNVNERV